MIRIHIVSTLIENAYKYMYLLECYMSKNTIRMECSIYNIKHDKGY